MDQAERKDTAQHALVYVGVAVTVVIVLVLLWYAIDVVLLAFVGILFAILLRAPADWLAARFGLSERWSLAIVGTVRSRCDRRRAALRARRHRAIGAARRPYPRDRRAVKAAPRRKRARQPRGRARGLSGLFAGGDGQFIGRGLGLIGSTFGAIANVLIVIFFAVFMAAQPRPYVEGFLFLVPRRRRNRAREVLYEIGNVLRRWLIGQSLLAAAWRSSPASA